jgi:hypothetical protein
MSRATGAVVLALALSVAPLAAQNLLVNPDFDQDVAGWSQVCGPSFDWVAEDEAGCPGSGAAHVLCSDCMGIQGAGIGVCVQVGALETAWASARVRPSGGFGVVAMSFYDNPGCTEPSASQQVAPAVPATGDWMTVAFDAVAIPAGTVSILVGFGGAVAVGPIESDVDFAYFGARPLVFRDDFEGNAGGGEPTCRWSLVAP